MNYNEFSIGLEFWCDDKRWCCTDIGTRVIVAISLVPHEVVRLKTDTTDRSRKIEARELSNDSSWLIGPPYAVPERVFDEYDIGCCSLAPEKRVA